MKNTQEQILGEWKIAPEGVVEFGDTSMIFKENGILDYIIHLEGKDQIMLLTFRIEGEFIISDQPSAPSKEKTPFILNENELLLQWGGKWTKYLRV